MTPRTVKGNTGVDFARQLAELNASSQPQKKFRASAAPKGTKLAAGYHDRTQDRIEDDEDDKSRRVKALEESMKLGQIDRGTFEKLRDEITGGDIAATHLVKGLDRRLLERVRRGEDVLSGDGKKAGEKMAEPQVDEEFEKLEEKEVAPLVKEKAVKRGEMAPPPPVAGTKRSRDAILAELKASRKAAAEAQAAANPQLGSKFRRIGEKRETSRIEIDARGREVLIIQDEEGNVKRKVRKPKSEKQNEAKALQMPDKDAKPLGMEAPEIAVPAAPSDDDDDIFEGIGAAYDPLAGLDDGSDSSSEDEETEKQQKAESSLKPARGEQENAAPTPPASATAAAAAAAVENEPTEERSTAPTSVAPSTTRNYFNEKPSQEQHTAPINPLSDPVVLSALKKASTTDVLKNASTDQSPDDLDTEERLKKRAAMLADSDRDYEDMDLGFGSSRLADEEDAEGGRIKLSKWSGGGIGDEEDGEGGRDKEAKKRKRKSKKKGDKHSAADVLKVLEQRKATT